MNLTAIEDALQAAVVSASGVAGDRVRWTAQSRDVPATAGDLIILALREDSASGPEHTVADAAVPTPGAEIVMSSTEQVDATLTLDCYSMTPNGAMARLWACRRGLWKYSITAALDAAGIAPIEFSTPQHLPTILETEYRDRAWGDLRIRIADGVSEVATYIETVVVTDTL